MAKDKSKIKILSPIDKLEELDTLIKSGADEFFCGVLIDSENISCRRAGGIRKSNFSSLKDLEVMIKTARKKGVDVFVAINRPSINLKRRGLIERSMKRVKNMGAKGIIVADLNLLDYFKNSNVELVASSLLEAKNPETMKFLRDEFKINRIILDRQITREDIKDITSEFPDLEIEAFVMNSACRSLASACRYQNVAKGNNHLCCFSFSLKKGANSKQLNDDELKTIASRLTLPVGACGICALYHFKKAGINSVKVVGRGKSTGAKVKGVKIVKEALRILDKYPRADVFYRKAENLFQETFGKKCQRQYCYYPHFFK